MDVRTVGVEEELLLVEPETGRARAVSGAVLRGTETYAGGEERMGTELQCEQLEIDTRPCSSLDELGREVRRRRLAAAKAARAAGAEIIALATSPLPVSPSMTPDSRYRWMAREYLLDDLLARRNGAEQQRAVHRRRAELSDVVAHAVDRTAGPRVSAPFG